VNQLRKLWVWAVCCTWLGEVLAQTPAATGGLESKPVRVLTELQTILLSIAGILATIAFIIFGVGMMYYKKRWEEISTPVIGALIAGSASAIASFLIK